MARYGCSKFWAVLTAILGCSAVWPEPASAGVMLDARYTGVVNDIEDTYGVFGPVAPGDTVRGVIRYSPTQPPIYADPTYAFYDFPVTSGGHALMTSHLGALDLRSTQDVVVQTYNMEDPNSPADSFYGYDFQFIDGDTSLLTTTGLPTGYTLSFASTYIALFATDPSLFDFPNAPSTLLPFGQYDSDFTGGFLGVTVRNASGRFVENAFIGFQVTSVAAVPEPSTALLALAASPLIVVWARWRRTSRSI